MILQTCNRVELFLDAKDPKEIRNIMLREWALETKFKVGELNRLVDTREGKSVVAYLVFVATRSSNYVLTKDSLSHRDRNARKLLILDLSNPRNVAPNVGEMDNVIFRTMDDLRGIADDALAKRRELVKEAEVLLGPRVEKINALLRREEAEPIVSDIYRRADQIREEVLKRTLSKMDL